MSWPWVWDKDSEMKGQPGVEGVWSPRTWSGNIRNATCSTILEGSFTKNGKFTLYLHTTAMT